MLISLYAGLCSYAFIKSNRTKDDIRKFLVAFIVAYNLTYIVDISKTSSLLLFYGLVGVVAPLTFNLIVSSILSSFEEKEKENVSENKNQPSNISSESVVA